MAATSLATLPVRSYESLEGGQGRSIYYRAERIRPRALLARIPPGVEVGDRAVRLYDLSATGLSYWADARDALPDAGTHLPVRLSLGGVDAFVAQAEIVRHEPSGDRTKVALRFLDQHLIAGKLRTLHDRLDYQRRASQGLDTFAAVPADYRAVCGEARLFLEHWRILLDQRERQLRASAGPEDFGRLLAEAEQSALGRMRTEWHAIHAAANESSREIVEGEALEASKLLTETLITPALRDSPFLWRCYVKPQGYPGDYVAMSWMYDGRRRGETIYGRLLDQLGHEERLAATVKVRKQLMVRHIRECVAEASSRHTGPIRIVSIGAGPAREVADYLGTADCPGELEFVLIDQDEQALAFAYDELSRVALRHAGRVRIFCRNVSFAQLFSLPELLGEVTGADMIYSAGLFDYLRDDVARMLVDACFGLLRPGGRLVVGNAAALPAVRWMPEFALDWTMLYRTEAQLLALAPRVEGIEIERDESETWLFLVARSAA